MEQSSRPVSAGVRETLLTTLLTTGNINDMIAHHYKASQ